MKDKDARLTQQSVAEPDAALVSYLDTLLAEIGERPATTVAEPVVKAIQDRADILPESAVTAEAGNAQTATDDAVVRTPPAWAVSPFQVLQFSLGSVKLAVPLSELLGILPLQGGVSRLPGQPPWALGVVRNREHKVVVVDTRRLLMPTHAAVESAPVYSHILLIGDGDRGLAVNALEGTEMIDQTAIRWRGRHDRHPWYAGIINEKLIAVIDVDGIMGMLAA